MYNLFRAIMDEESDTICKEDIYDYYEKCRHPLYQIVSRYNYYHSLLIALAPSLQNSRQIFYLLPFWKPNMILMQVLSNDARLLKHPLVHTLLEWKLNKFGWLYYYINLMAYLILVVFLTTFILVIPNPQSYKC